ncbi:hypothetical protein Q9251_02930 [Alkalihalobacillus macyae]|uniref:hypothetical protein n=1 Tax=Guptibacillus hwajinpoensis TaxID=208199 RepID=UPI00273CA85C|nr:hypothetical protein [Alkalihalobacillus macyae]MDP4549829.1 hypothetical protein [Alkalihalobacillus macyae]
MGKPFLKIFKETEQKELERKVNGLLLHKKKEDIISFTYDEKYKPTGMAPPYEQFTTEYVATIIYHVE